MMFYETYVESKKQSKKSEYSAISIQDSIYVGVDLEDHPTIILKSLDKNNFIQTSTKNLQLKCNINLSFLSDNEEKNEFFNIIKCLSNSQKEIKVFLKLCEAFFSEVKTTNDILEDYSILSSFFDETLEYNEKELQGIYCELFAINYFPELNLSKKWQCRDRLKYDFSISENVKIEVKSTKTEHRKHTFSYDQVATNIYQVYIFSYKVQWDGEGQKLSNLIDDVIENNEFSRFNLVKLSKIKRFLLTNELLDVQYNSNFLKENLRIFDAKSIPQVSNIDPERVTDVKFVSDLTNLTDTYDELVFVKKILESN